MISSAFDVKAQWTKCMTSWCPYLPLTGKQEIKIIYSPLERSSTKEIVLKVDTCLLLKLQTGNGRTEFSIQQTEWADIEHEIAQINRV